MSSAAIIAGMPLVVLLSFTLACDAWMHWKYHRELNWRLGDFWIEFPLAILGIIVVLFQVLTIVAIN